MAKIWVTSDTHFNHANIIRYCQRPYSSVQEMNEDLIARWNKCVKPGDTVYHLGDFAMGIKPQVHELRRALNGKIKLIKGNHDNHTNQWYRECEFDEVYDRPIIVMRAIILSHAPLSGFGNDSDFVNLYGHVHNNPDFVPFTERSYNVGVDTNDYAPILFDDVIDKFAF